MHNILQGISSMIGMGIIGEVVTGKVLLRGIDWGDVIGGNMPKGDIAG